jgi:hypothetical protein
LRKAVKKVITEMTVPANLKLPNKWCWVVRISEMGKISLEVQAIAAIWINSICKVVIKTGSCSSTTIVKVRCLLDLNKNSNLEW